MVESAENVGLSIIVPVFMVEKYLPECIESILNQKMDDFELILVEDCSPDNSGKICDEYAERDKRIRVIHQKKRLGAGRARFKGLSEAKGDYIGFVDADDRIHSDMYQVLYSVALQYSSEMVCCECVFEYVNNRVVSDVKEKVEVLSQSEAMLYVHNGQAVYPYLVNKLFKKSVLKQSCEQNEIVIGEDYRFTTSIIQNVDRVVWLNKPLYYYRQRKSSACNSGLSEKHMAVLENYQEMREKLSHAYPTISKVINSYCITEEMIVLQAMAKNKVYEKDIAKKVKKDVSSNLRQYIQQDHISVVFKLSAIAVALCPRLFVLVMRLYIPLKNRKNILFD